VEDEVEDEVVVGFDEVCCVVEAVGVYLTEEIGEAFLVEVGGFLPAPKLTEPPGPKLKQDGDIGAVTSCTGS
jgi:hypothetical protein